MAVEFDYGHSSGLTAMVLIRSASGINERYALQVVKVWMMGLAENDHLNRPAKDLFRAALADGECIDGAQVVNHPDIEPIKRLDTGVRQKGQIELEVIAAYGVDLPIALAQGLHDLLALDVAGMDDRVHPIQLIQYGFRNGIFALPVGIRQRGDANHRQTPPFRALRMKDLADYTPVLVHMVAWDAMKGLRNLDHGRPAMDAFSSHFSTPSWPYAHTILVILAEIHLTSTPPVIAERHSGVMSSKYNNDARSQTILSRADDLESHLYQASADTYDAFQVVKVQAAIDRARTLVHRQSGFVERVSGRNLSQAQQHLDTAAAELAQMFPQTHSQPSEPMRALEARREMARDNGVLLISVLCGSIAIAIGLALTVVFKGHVWRESLGLGALAGFLAGIPSVAVLARLGSLKASVVLIFSKLCAGALAGAVAVWALGVGFGPLEPSSWGGGRAALFYALVFGFAQQLVSRVIDLRLERGASPPGEPTFATT
jgi:hypothetical protein